MSDKVYNKIREVLTARTTLIDELTEHIHLKIKPVTKNIYKYVYHPFINENTIIEIYSNEYTDLINYLFDNPYNKLNLLFCSCCFNHNWFCEYDPENQPNNICRDGKYSLSEWCDEMNIDTTERGLNNLEILDYIEWYFS